MLSFHNAFFFLKQYVGKEKEHIVTHLSIMQVAISLWLVCAYENYLLYKEKKEEKNTCRNLNPITKTNGSSEINCAKL